MNKKKVQKILEILEDTFPNAKTSLHFKTPHQMLVSTILSAQCTDERVNKVTPALFKKYPNINAFALAKQEELEQDIRSTGFYRNKSKNIIGASKIIVHEYGGKLPNSMDGLTSLPGVARKTANVVLQNAFGIVDGVVVDTHVGRLSRRIGFTKEDDAVKVEKDLMKNLPKEKWEIFSHMLIALGRNVCKSAKPACEKCVLNELCVSAFKV